MFWCDHPYSQRFRKSLPLKVLQYCKKKKTPHNFQVTLVIALEDLLRDKPPLQSIEVSSAVHKLIQAQKKIGWLHILRGFLSIQWQKYLEYELNHNSAARTPDYFDYASFYGGLIRLMWAQQSILWKDLQLRNEGLPTLNHFFLSQGSTAAQPLLAPNLYHPSTLPLLSTL